MSNPIQYTSRTYQTILNDINSVADLADKPEWWKRIWAGVGDVLSVYLNAQANNSFLRTAFTRQAVADLCELIDYDLSPRTTSSGILVINFKSTVAFPLAILVADIAAQTSGIVSAKRFEGRSAISIPAQETETFTAAAGTDLLTVATLYYTGQKVRVSSTTTLPAGLSAGTDYWLIAVSATTVRIASSLVNAKAGTYIDITDVGTGVHTLHLLSTAVTIYQQETKAEYAAGTASGTEEWQEIDLADKYVLRDTLAITINAVSWSVLGTGVLDSSFVFSGAADKVVKLIYNTDESSKLRFGDGIYGQIPGVFDVIVQYAVGGGADSNISAGRITIYAGSAADVESVYNPAAMTGGAGAESLVVAKALAPLLLKARDRFITVEDGEALVLAYGGISLAKINKNVYGLLSCQVLCVATGGGNPSGALKTALQQYLIDRSILESVDIRVEDATITAVAVTSAIKVLSGYLYANVEPFFELAWSLLLTETGNEIYTDYLANGIASATTLINSIFGTAFGSGDYPQIEDLVSHMTPRDFADTIQQSDVLGYIDQWVHGVDYVTVASPAFPVAFADDEISTVGVLTLTEIP